jgi:hypothetical protein
MPVVPLGFAVVAVPVPYPKVDFVSYAWDVAVDRSKFWVLFPLSRCFAVTQ